MKGAGNNAGEIEKNRTEGIRDLVIYRN